MKISLYTLCLAVFFLFACNKRHLKDLHADNSTQIENLYSRVWNINDENKYDEIIKTASYGLLELSGDSNFLQLVKNLSLLKFDEDDNVLFKTIDSQLSSNGVNLKQIMIHSLQAYNQDELIPYVDEVLNGFKYYEDTLYPQIYIPFVENWQNDEINPVICLNIVDSSIQQGIQINEGQLNEGYFDEQYAENNNTWVISTNETVNNLGKKPKLNAVGDGSRVSPTDIYININQIYITDKKESWANGRADLFHLTVIYEPNNSNNIKDYSISEPYCKLANTDLSKWYVPQKAMALRELSRFDGTPYAAEWEAQSKGEILVSLLFEKDCRQRYERSYTFCPGKTMYYISKEEPYGVITPTASHYQSHNGYNALDKDYTLTGGTFQLKGHTTSY